MRFGSESHPKLFWVLTKLNVVKPVAKQMHFSVKRVIEIEPGHPIEMFEAACAFFYLRAWLRRAKNRRSVP